MDLQVFFPAWLLAPFFIFFGRKEKLYHALLRYLKIFGRSGASRKKLCFWGWSRPVFLPKDRPSARLSLKTQPLKAWCARPPYFPIFLELLLPQSPSPSWSSPSLFLKFLPYFFVFNFFFYKLLL